MNKPEGFVHQVQVAANYLEIDNKILYLKRADGALFEPGKWGPPAGKIESNETPENGAIRELFEETGISLKSSFDIQLVHSLYVRKPKVEYIFHQFRVQLDQIPDVCLSNEHQDFKWATPNDFNHLTLMDGEAVALKHYRAAVPKPNRI